MEPTFRLLRVRGIPVGVHWTGPVAFVIVAWTLAFSVFPSAYPALAGNIHILMAVAAAGLLFASVVLHELSHAVAARREGMPVEGITLWLLGGVSDMGQRARSPGQELRMAASGPAVSVLLAVAFAAAALGGRRLGWPEAVPGVLGYVARLNLVVAAFNLIPALPLDGGRILRAWLWRRQRDLLAATRSGTRAGQAFGLTLLVVGVLNLRAGAGFLGVWLLVLGGFLLRAASSELADARTRHRLAGLTAADVMASDPGVVLRDTPVARLVERPPVPVRSGYPVLGGGRLMGVVELASARRLPTEERARRLVEDVMTPLDDIPMVDAGAPVLDIIDRLDGSNPSGQVVVIADGCVVGIVDEGDVAVALDRARPPTSAGDGDGVAVDGRVPRRRGAGVRAWAVVAMLCLVTGAALYRPPYALVAAGPMVDVGTDVSIAGAPVTALNGRFLVASVDVRRTSALGALVATIGGRGHLVPVADIDDRTGELGGGWEEAGAHPDLARETRTLAAAAAARSQGLPAAVSGTGARVVAVRAGSPADGVLRVGDVIVAADGRSVTQAGLLADAARGLAPGAGLRLSVERPGGAVDLVLRPGEGGGAGLATGIGVVVETRDLTVELPFEVRFSGHGAVGPGAGLAYALAIADLLSSTDLARGRTIVAAGSIAADGHVGPVGGMDVRGDAAAAAGTTLFVVPADDVAGARRPDLKVEGVADLARALEALSTTV